MLRPRNGPSPPREAAPEPDTPISHYSPTMPPADYVDTQNAPNGNAPPLEYADEKVAGTSSATALGLGLATRRGSQPMSIPVGNANTTTRSGYGKTVKLGMCIFYIRLNSGEDARGITTDCQAYRNELGPSSGWFSHSSSSRNI